MGRENESLFAASGSHDLHGCHAHTFTAAFTYYFDPVILRNKLTSLSIFRDLALRKRDSKKLMFYFYMFYRVYTNIQTDKGW